MSVIGRQSSFLTVSQAAVISVFNFTISANLSAASNLRTLAINAGWNTVDKVICTINSGVYILGPTANATGLTVNGSFPNTVELVNNGAIYGGFGASGPGGTPLNGVDGGPGGTALLVSVPITITNNGTIAGGGGGGGGDGGNRDITGTVNTNGSDGGNGAYGPFLKVDRGGPLGTAGTAGTTGTPGLDIFGGYNATSPGAGGAAGKSVNGNSNITWAATGTRIGPIV